METTIIYNSKTGFTKRYADWIAEELGCHTMPYKDFVKAPTAVSEIVIFGSRIHAGRIEQLEKVKPLVKGKLIVFAIGATPASVTHAIDKIWADNFSEKELEAIPHFYMQGGLDYGHMGILDGFLMKVVSILLSKKKEKSEDEAGFEQAIKHSYDSSSKEYIQPLVEHVKKCRATPASDI
jgi:flavodoxin